MLQKSQVPAVFDQSLGENNRTNLDGKNSAPSVKSNDRLAVLSFDETQITSKENSTKVEPGSPVPTLNKEGRVDIFMAGQGAKAGGVGHSETTSPTLKGVSSGLNSVPSVSLCLLSGDAYGKMDPEKETYVTGTLQSHSKKHGHAMTTQQAAESGQMFPGALGGVRRLTPVECERLQGFPDGWTEWGLDKNGKKVMQSDSARYRQIGNAVAVTVAEWIVKRIKENAENHR